MNDALLIGLLEQQSISNYESPEEKQASSSNAPVAFSTAPVDSVSAVNLTESTLPTTQAQPESSPSLARASSSPVVLAQPQPQSNQVQKFSYISDDWYCLETASQKIPDYRPADSCSNCMFATWDSVKGSASCAYYKTQIVSSYICSQYKSPADLAPASTDDDQDEMYSDDEAQRFSDRTIYSQAVAAAKDKFENLEDEPAQLWLLRKYGQLYKEKHGSTEGAIV